MSLIWFDVTVIGCSEISPPDGAFVSRHLDSAAIICNQSSETYYITCRDGHWSGHFGNCTTTAGALNLAVTHTILADRCYNTVHAHVCRDLSSSSVCGGSVLWQNCGSSFLFDVLVVSYFICHLKCLRCYITLHYGSLLMQKLLMTTYV